ncbi:MAG: hemolysin III family protein, partial [Eubacterium sp.]
RGEGELLRLKKLDHAMIFLLIAGSYTPFCLLCLTGPMRIGMMAAIWGVAIIGILMMVFWIGMPRWLNTTLYIALGWFALFALKPLYEALPTGGFVLLILGGVLYTIGGVMYGLKKPNFSQRWGFHEIFHIFVLLGSACHFAAVFRYLLMV